MVEDGVALGVDGVHDAIDDSPDAPTRQVNTVIAPGGYMGRWMRANGATRSLIQLYRSAYAVETIYGFAAQQQSGVAQLVTNTKAGVSTEVGMSMAPALWLVNFTLIYTLNPRLAADMPAYCAPIPAPVTQAILASPTGQVPYSKYESDLPWLPSRVQASVVLCRSCDSTMLGRGSRSFATDAPDSGVRPSDASSTVAPSVAPSQLSGSAFGLLATVQSAGNLFASSIAGLLWTAVAPGEAFIFLAAAMLLAAVLTMTAARAYIRAQLTALR